MILWVSILSLWAHVCTHIWWVLIYLNYYPYWNSKFPIYIARRSFFQLALKSFDMTRIVLRIASSLCAMTRFLRVVLSIFCFIPGINPCPRNPGFLWLEVGFQNYHLCPRDVQDYCVDHCLEGIPVVRTTMYASVLVWVHV